MARDEFDFYPTPDPVAKAVVQAIYEQTPNPPVLVEPSAGSGAFVRPARALWPTTPLLAVEVDDRHTGKLMESGATLYYLEPWEAWLARSAPSLPAGTLVFGNPPFSLAVEHIGLALDLLKPGSRISMLLKMNFLCSKGRAIGFWPRRQLRWLRPFDTRPKFIVGGSSDNNEYALFTWEVGFDGVPEIVFPHVSWSKKVEDA